MIRTEAFNKTMAQAKSDAVLASIPSIHWTHELMMLIADCLEMAEFIDGTIEEAGEEAEVK